jgi:predicted secreted hydrolase
MRTTGTLNLGGQDLTVTGESWMDHEFGSNQLANEEAGWDWYSLQLDDGTELMLYRLRRQDGSLVPESSGTFVGADGKATNLRAETTAVDPQGHWTSRKSGAVYPMGWTIKVPSQGLDLLVAPALEDQELRTQASAGETYWEGAVTVTGTRAQRPVKGHGYIEMTGYAGKFKARI